MTEGAKSTLRELEKGAKVEALAKRRGIGDSYFPMIASLPDVTDRDLEKVAKLTASGKSVSVANALLLMRGSTSYLLQLPSSIGSICEAKCLKGMCSHETLLSNQMRNFDKDIAPSVKTTVTTTCASQVPRAASPNESAKKDQPKILEKCTPVPLAETRAVEDAQSLVVSSSDGAVNENLVKEHQKGKMSGSLKEAKAVVDVRYWTSLIPSRARSKKQAEAVYKGTKIKFPRETPAVIDVHCSMASSSRGVVCDNRQMRGNINPRSIASPVCSSWIKVGLIVILSIIFFCTLRTFPLHVTRSN